MKTENQDIRGNRNHKDALFRMVFSKKEDLLDLYNAVRGTAYQNAEDLEVNTLENVLYMAMKNDISFMIDCTMNLYEHQSSYNPNMPLRGLMYFVQLYSKYADQRKLNLYSTTIQKIPTPQFVVFYNGMKEEPDRQILKLSDAFQAEGGCIECEATMLNINLGRNMELMEKCRRLEEYATFVSTVRKYTQAGELDLGEAIRQAMDECIEKGILSDILTNQRAEVKDEVRAEVKDEVRAEVKDEVRAEVKDEIRAEVRAEAQRSLVEILKELGTPKEIIIDKIMEKFSLTNAQAKNLCLKHFGENH